MSPISGSCLCGGVRFTVSGEIDDFVACHCNQCRKTSGHFVVATRVPDDRITFDSHSTLQWFDSSEQARRGFCGSCGSSLFWKCADRSTTSIMAGSLDGPTGRQIVEVLFEDNAADYCRTGTPDSGGGR